jgi:hypothetical protein
MTGDYLLDGFLRAAVLERRRAYLSHPVRRRSGRRAAAKYGRLR